jgi:hypothetical protein
MRARLRSDGYLLAHGGTVFSGGAVAHVFAARP